MKGAVCRLNKETVFSHTILLYQRFRSWKERGHRENEIHTAQICYGVIPRRKSLYAKRSHIASFFLRVFLSLPKTALSSCKTERFGYTPRNMKRYVNSNYNLIVPLVFLSSL